MLDKKFTIAVIDDNVGDVDLLRHQLSRIPDLDMEFLYFDNPDRGMEAILRRTVDFIFLDYRLGAQTGLYVLKTFRDSGNLRAIIILTEESDAQVAAELMRAGADDYLIKRDVKPNVLMRSMKHAYERYLRREAEKTQSELLTKTLAGSVRMLIDLLATVKPKAFGRAVRVQKRVNQICRAIRMENAWEADIAAMLSHVGCLTVSDVVLDKVVIGEPLTEDEASAYYRHPKMTSDMIRRIPRLGGVAAIVAYQEKRYDGSGIPADSLSRDDIPFGARVLKVALDFDALTQQGLGSAAAVREMRARKGWYDLNIVEALESVLSSETGYEVRQVNIADLTPNMILDEHLQTENGAIVVPKGERLSGARAQRLQTLAAFEPLREPVTVRIPLAPSKEKCDESMAAMTGMFG